MVNRELRRVQDKSKVSAQKKREAASQRKKSGGKKGEKPNIWKRITQFLRDVRIEMKKVIWPSRAEVINYTIVVFITVGVITTFVLTMDLVLAKLMNWII